MSYDENDPATGGPSADRSGAPSMGEQGHTAAPQPVRPYQNEPYGTVPPQDAHSTPYQTPQYSPVPPYPTGGYGAAATGPGYAPGDRPVSIPPGPRPTSSHVAGIAVTIAVLGVLLSAVVGAASGYFGARLAGAGNGTGTSYNPFGSLETSQVISNAGTEPVSAAAAVALPSIVNIDVTTGGGDTSSDGLPQGHPDVPSGGTGSGVAYKAAPDGGTYIITNNHVVENASDIVVTEPGGEKVTGELIGTDPETDIAVVKVPAKIRTITVANSDGLIVGQTLVAIGSPFGLEHSVSSGVVSAVHRSITSSSITGTGTDYSLVDAIQTDAAINPGNSGGALVDRLGRLVGINSAIYTESGSSAGVGFAIPANTATRIADELISGGKATHPFLGVEGRTVTKSEADAAGMPTAAGAIVMNVFDNTGASKAGIKKNDIIVAVDSTPIRTMDDLILAIRRHGVGDTVKLTLWRNHSKIELEMTVGDKPPNL